jgi:dTDP-4-dehydrorhamnose 3,5-epimerase
MIDGVKKIPLVRHADDRGYVTEILRRDAPHFKAFGQIYVTSCRRNVVKAWHCHKKQTDHFYAIKGTLKIGLFDDRPKSPTNGEYNVFILGDDGEDVLLIIPPRVWHGQMALSEMSYLINIPTEPYNHKKPDELRKGVEELEDIWTIRNR